jgi:hypothetical protein
MAPKSTKLFLLFISLAILLPSHIVLADTGPKPTMDFEFRYELAESELTIISGILYECDQPDCSDAAPLEELGPQRFTCNAKSCGATAYGFAPYHKIEIEFSDEQTRQSNIFETAGFDSKYTVTVRPEDLLVEAQFGLNVPPRLGAGTLLIACICALIGIGLLAGVIILLRRRSAAT